MVATPGWHQGPVEEGWGDGRDRLARVLHTLRMRGTFYCHTELGEPWALEMPAISDSVSFHVVTSGVCWLRLPDAEPVELRAAERWETVGSELGDATDCHLSLQGERGERARLGLSGGIGSAEPGVCARECD
jgi:hypothetical protein